MGDEIQNDHLACSRVQVSGLGYGLAVFGFVMAMLAMAPLSALGQVDFGKQIQPLWERSCYPCHSANQSQSGFRLDVRQLALAGGESQEAAIVAGKSQDSLVMQYARGDVAGLEMPPNDSNVPKLSLEELKLLQTWIDEGAVWPDSHAGELEVAPVHWSLQPLVEPALPSFPPATASDLSAARAVSIPDHPLDRWIAAKLLERELQPSPPADRATLIRRVTFDLTGLPPTPNEIDAFLADRAPDAYERLVDRLLASPHYGERWGRHWLDVVRYTESQGFEYDHLRDKAWHYRDYVIQSFNSDKPYDQFMREQIAGDVLEPVTREGIVAAGFLVCGPWDQAGNSQANATQKAITREEEMEDLVAVVGQSFLGLTINCARCHAHKFDPIPQEEYFGVKAVFDGVRHGERTLDPPSTLREKETQAKLATEQLQRVRKARAELEAMVWRRLAAKKAGSETEPGPTPWKQWSFHEETPRFEGELRGGAVVENGALQLPAPGAYLQSEPLPADVADKTLEAWVQISDREQRGGAPISIETRNGLTFDAIVFGEREPRHWMAGSDGFQRTRNTQSMPESSRPDEWIHLAIVYEGNRIAIFRNGEAYGDSYTVPNGVVFKQQESHIVLGMRHQGGRRLNSSMPCPPRAVRFGRGG